MSTEILRAFVGLDGRELDGHRVCVGSLERHASVPLLVEPLDVDALARGGLYRRTWTLLGGQVHDALDGEVSSEFTYTRYLVPALCQYRGWALFCDSDFLWLADVAELWALRDARYALQVVKHDHQPHRLETHKMRGQRQRAYPRKNWTSLMLVNCGHPAHRALTAHYVGGAPREWLHQLCWLDDDEIGGLPLEWNWLAGISAHTVDPKAVHFTLGTPDMPGHNGAPYADAWRAELAR